MPTLRKLTEAERDEVLRSLVREDPWSCWLADARPGDMYEVTFAEGEEGSGRARLRKAAMRAGLALAFLRGTNYVQVKAWPPAAPVEPTPTETGEAPPAAPGWDGLPEKRRAFVEWIHKEDAGPILCLRGGVQLSLVAREAMRNGRVVDLSPSEWPLLAALAARQGMWSTAEILSSHCGGISRAVVSMRVTDLRRKLGDEAIRAKKGKGYALALEEASTAATATEVTGDV